MGIGNFLDNFMSGLAFGMIANSPFFGGMGYYGAGFTSGRTIDFGTFANPFPNIFGNVDYSQAAQPISILNTFANPGFPQPDFSQVSRSIWDNVFNPDPEYDKKMKEYFEKLSKNSTSYYNQTSFQGYEMPFSSWFLPTQINFGGFMPQIQYRQSVKSDEQSKASRLEPTETDATVSRGNFNYDITSLKTKWSKKKNLPDAFYNKVIHISKKIKCDPNDLMGVMWYETAHTFDPAKTNRIGATGLIQFMPETAKKLGTTTSKLRTMSAVEQLEYVEQYLVSNKSAAGYKDSEVLDRGALYSLVFLPGRSKKAVLTTKGENFYEQNTNLDYDKDGKITKADLNTVISANLA